MKNKELRERVEYAVGVHREDLLDGEPFADGRLVERILVIIEEVQRLADRPSRAPEGEDGRMVKFIKGCVESDYHRHEDHSAVRANRYAQACDWLDRVATRPQPEAQLPGVSGNYASTPDDTPLDIAETRILRILSEPCGCEWQGHLTKQCGEHPMGPIHSPQPEAGEREMVEALSEMRTTLSIIKDDAPLPSRYVRMAQFAMEQADKALAALRTGRTDV